MYTRELDTLRKKLAQHKAENERLNEAVSQNPFVEDACNREQSVLLEEINALGSNLNLSAAASEFPAVSRRWWLCQWARRVCRRYLGEAVFCSDVRSFFYPRIRALMVVSRVYETLLNLFGFPGPVIEGTGILN